MYRVVGGGIWSFDSDAPSASNLTLKLVLHHDELKNVNHVVLRAPL